MRLRVWIVALLGLIVLSLPIVMVAQTDVGLQISPEIGTVGEAVFTITAEGLEEGETYTITFIHNDVVVFSTDEVATDDGSIVFSAASTPDDDIGAYTIQLLADDEVIAETTFSLTDGEDTTSDDRTDVESDSTGEISITPSSGPIGTVHTILLSGLEPDERYTVEVSALEIGELVYRRVWTSDAEGKITIEIFAEEGDDPGLQGVSVFNDESELVAEGQFTIDAPPERDVVVDISPEVAPAGTEFTIDFSGLAQFDQVSAQITSEQNILIETLSGRASSAGEAVLSFRSDASLAEGEYTVSIFVEDQNTAELSLTIGDATEVTSSATALINVSPEAGEIGSVHRVTIADLEPNQDFTLTVADASGEVVYSTDRSADGTGDFSMNLSSSEGDVPGTYEIAIVSGGESIAQATLTILPAGDEASGNDVTAQAGIPGISVSPDAGANGTTYTITLSGMPAGERVGVVIRSQADDSLALSSVVRIDDNGDATVEYTSRDVTVPGGYDVVATHPSGELASTSLTVEGAIATIDPQAGPTGTSHRVTVAGLDADETVTFDVVFEAEVIYSTEKTADGDGVATLNLTTDASDAIGDYTINVVRESGYQPSLILTVTGDDSDTGDETTSGEEDTNAQVEPSGEGETYSGQLNGDQPTDTYEFEGEEGNFVIIRVMSDDFDPTVSLLDDEGYELAYNDDSAGTYDSQIGPFPLPYTGEYSVSINQSGGFESIEPGEFVLTIETVDIETIAFGEDVSFMLDDATPAVYYQFDGTAGESIDVTVDSDGSIDTVLQILYSDGYEFSYDDDSGSGFDPELNHVIFSYDDTYILVLSKFIAGEEGSGTITVSRNPVHSLDEGDVTITLNDKQYRDIVVFEAMEGEVVTLNLVTLSGEVGDFYVTATIDDMTVMSYSSMGVPDHLPLMFVVPMDGTVNVVFEEYGYSDSISFEVSLTKE